jgi:hypothetical protein
LILGSVMAETENREPVTGNGCPFAKDAAENLPLFASQESALRLDALSALLKSSIPRLNARNTGCPPGYSSDLSTFFTQSSILGARDYPPLPYEAEGLGDLWNHLHGMFRGIGTAMGKLVDMEALRVGSPEAAAAIESTDALIHDYRSMMAKAMGQAAETHGGKLSSSQVRAIETRLSTQYMDAFSTQFAAYNTALSRVRIIPIQYHGKIHEIPNESKLLPKLLAYGRAGSYQFDTTRLHIIAGDDAARLFGVGADTITHDMSDLAIHSPIKEIISGTLQEQISQGMNTLLQVVQKKASLVQCLYAAYLINGTPELAKTVGALLDLAKLPHFPGRIRTGQELEALAWPLLPRWRKVHIDPEDSLAEAAGKFKAKLFFSHSVKEKKATVDKSGNPEATVAFGLLEEALGAQRETGHCQSLRETRQSFRGSGRAKQET